MRSLIAHLLRWADTFKPQGPDGVDDDPALNCRLSHLKI